MEYIVIICNAIVQIFEDMLSKEMQLLICHQTTYNQPSISKSSSLVYHCIAQTKMNHPLAETPQWEAVGCMFRGRMSDVMAYPPKYHKVTETCNTCSTNRITYLVDIETPLLDHIACRPAWRVILLARMDMPCLFIYEIITFFKINQSNPTYSFRKCSDVHNHNTRQNTFFHVNHLNTSNFRNSCFHYGILLYNKLPNHIKTIQNETGFKNKLKASLQEHIFYSVDDIMKCTT